MEKVQKVLVCKPGSDPMTIMPTALAAAMKLGFQVVQEPAKVETCPTAKEISNPVPTVDLSKNFNQVKAALKGVKDKPTLVDLFDQERQSKNRISVITAIQNKINE